MQHFLPASLAIALASQLGLSVALLTPSGTHVGTLSPIGALDDAPADISAKRTSAVEFEYAVEALTPDGVAFLALIAEA